MSDMPAVHRLKTWAVYWDAVARHEKLFEVRKNDRFFQPGDEVHLQRWNNASNALCYEAPDGERSSYPQKDGTFRFRVGPVLQGGQFGIEPGYCVFSLLPLRELKEQSDV